MSSNSSSTLVASAAASYLLRVRGEGLGVRGQGLGVRGRGACGGLVPLALLTLLEQILHALPQRLALPQVDRGCVAQAVEQQPSQLRLLVVA